MAISLLLADDSPTIAKILGMALQNEDYEIRSVLTADDAVRELRANPPAFFLVDLTLPGKNGFEFAELIRGDAKLSKIKVVFLSSAFEPVDEAAVKNSGADLVIAKPFDPSELRTSLRQLKDAPPKFPSGAKVQGSLSGQAVTAAEGTRTSLTDTALTRARETLQAPPTSAPQAEELLLGMTGDQDANSILAGLAENAPPPLELGNLTPSVPVLDLSNSFQTPPGGTKSLELAAASISLPELSFDSAPSVDVFTLPDETVTPPSAPRTNAKESLSANAEALAAFFSAEIDSQKVSPPTSPPAAREDFEASLSSIEWDNSSSPQDLDAWSASPQGSTDAPPPPPTKEAPPKFSRGQGQAAAPGLNSALFDTGGSNFRFAEDYITRITKSFVGLPFEERPQEEASALNPMFSQQSSDLAPPSGPGGWNPVDAARMEQIVREEVQMAVREVVEKVAWEVIPELAENIIKRELEKVMKQMES